MHSCLPRVSIYLGEDFMKATLEFHLEDDRHSLLVAIHARDIYLTLSDIHNRLRTHLKHGDEPQDRRVLQDVYQDVCDAMGRIEE